jgi:hypothetical protein
MKNLTRCDYERARGWLARVQRNGKLHSAFFADLKHGGTASAKRKAMAWLAETIEEAGPTLRDPARGTLFLHRQRRVLADGKVRHDLHWRADIRTAQGSRYVSRSVRRYGNAKAKALCAAWLKQMRSKQGTAAAKPVRRSSSRRR